MGRREYTRRAALKRLGIGTAGVIGAGAGPAAARVTPDGRRDDQRIRFVEADPEAGFNYPYWLATPATFRSEPVPLLVTMNSPREGRPLTGGGPDKPTTVAEAARSQIESFDQVGARVSERLGVPHLVPVIPQPDGDPVDSSHKTTLLDRETMLLEGTALERLDRQLLRMTDHARQAVLADRETHDELLFWGNSSGGVAAEHMAVMHPGEIMAFAAAGINGIATLPLAELGGHTLNYPVGVADLEAITGSPFDAAAFNAVNKFYIQGGRDTHNRLKFDVPGELPGVWADADVYETAKAVYGRDMAADRLPRCHIAFEKAGISGQFRLYPEMAHDPEPSAPAVEEFLRRSIDGGDVSDFGQRLTLPFDRGVELHTPKPAVGEPLDFAVSGAYPPPEGLVTYTWRTDGGRSASGPAATFTVDEPTDTDVMLAMETAHGQSTGRGMSLLAADASFAVFQYAVETPDAEIVVDEPMAVGVDATNVGSVTGTRPLALLVEDGTVAERDVELDPGGSTRLSFDHSFDETGTYEVRIPPAYSQTITVLAEPTRASTPPTPRPRATPTQSPRAAQKPATQAPPTTREQATASGRGPGFGVLAALVGIGGVVGFRRLGGSSDDE